MGISTPTLRGLVAATFTPLDPTTGDVDRGAVGRVVEYLVAEPLCALFLGGSTGEGTSLTCDERRSMTEAYLEHLAGRLPAIVHVGHNSLRDAADLARHAQGAGAFAIAMTPPCYYPVAQVERVVDCLEVVARAAPEMPLFYYHIPALTGVQVDVPELLERAEERLPSLVGVKYSDPSLDRLQRCVADHGERVNVLFGVDEMLLSGLAAGAHGAVGSTYGFLARRYAMVIDALGRGDLPAARLLAARVTRMVHAITARGGVPALRAAMALRGVDCGPPRLPLSALEPGEVAALERELRALGFFDTCPGAFRDDG